MVLVSEVLRFDLSSLICSRPDTYRNITMTTINIETMIGK